MAKHTVVLTYNESKDIRKLAMAVTEFLFLPYARGKKYQQSKVITERIKILEQILDPYLKEPIDKYLECINKDIMGLSELLNDIHDNIEKIGTGKYKITFNIEKL